MKNIFKSISSTYRRFYRMPEEAKRIIAIKNNRKLLLMQVFVVSLCSVLTLITFVIHKNTIKDYPIIFSNYMTMIVFGLITIIFCSIIKKHPKTKSSIQMLALHFTFTYTYILLASIFFSGHMLLNSFLIFACISIIIPLYFDIDPVFYGIIEFTTSLVIAIKVKSITGLPPSIDIIIFAIITITYSFNKWKASKSDYKYKKKQNEYVEKMEKELSLASLVQTSFFKHEENIYDNWSIVYYTKAMAGVSGDFFDIYNTDKKLNGLGIFDVSGHGIASGLVTMLVKNIIINEFNRGKSDNIKTVIDRINVRYLKEKGSIENYLTGILCRIDGNTIDFVNAGHSMPILYKDSEEHCVEIQRDKTERAFGAIGLIGMPSNFVEHKVELQTGDELILFTDGITDITNRAKEQYGRERLIKSINRNADRPLSTQINCIISDATNFAQGHTIEDDITMIILKKK